MSHTQKRKLDSFKETRVWIKQAKIKKMADFTVLTWAHYQQYYVVKKWQCNQKCR